MIDYLELAELADRIYAIAEDDVEKLADILDDLEPGVRNELLHSDFMNAFQVFYHAFRELPTELGEERLILQPATEIVRGVLVEERDLLELHFTETDGVPSVLVSDGEKMIRTFTGRGAYGRAVAFSEEYEP
ncbi:MAG: hypothetical protein APR53_03140 [Methanoculleus sp. SDB]|nr:MAG: hypothetical protein APR53_03140 [Methanoculleus sp. SDB]